MLFGILLTIQIIISISLAILVLIQRSEGGALGIGGGSPSGFMSARGAGNLLTRATSILGFLFFSCAIAMTIVGNLDSRRGSAIENLDTSGLVVDRTAQTPQAPASASVSSSAPSLADLPLAGATQPATAPASSGAPAPTRPASSVASSPAVTLKVPASSSTASSLTPQQLSQARASMGLGASSSSTSSAAQ